jgi:hypothetical protein
MPLASLAQLGGLTGLQRVVLAAGPPARLSDCLLSLAALPSLAHCSLAATAKRPAADRDDGLHSALTR